jgi:hypothetical protein
MQNTALSVVHHLKKVMIEMKDIVTTTVTKDIVIEMNVSDFQMEV